MASKKLKGITIEIDGNTTKLTDALKNTNKVIYSTNSELKALNSALKLDPKNTELLAQKQELLKKNIVESTNKLNQLKEAQRQMGDYNKLTDDQKESYRELTREISSSESAIKKLNTELKKTGSIDFSKISNTLKKVGEVAAEVLKKVTKAVATLSTALAGLVIAGVKSYAELEQNIGGIETLFGDSAQKVIDNAKKAYETAGVSANEYMQGVTSFSASLLQSLSGDTDKAADIADMAFKDMSDNANKFGTDMASIQNAYQGFAKQNYTMLDNLKLGYGGTKSEMERLLADAEKLTGVHYDISNLSDVYNAIHEIQNELGVTGTTSEEAKKTISGSMNAMKASFNNFLNGSGSPQELSETIVTFLKNISNTISELAPGILEGITTLVTELVPKVATLIAELLPQLLVAVQNMITSLLQQIQNNTKPISDMVVNLLMNLVNFILQNLPMVVKTGLDIIIALIQGITDSIPELLPTIVDVVLTIVEIVLDNISLVIDAGIELVMALIEGIINALPDLIERLPEIIDKVMIVLADNLPKLKTLGPKLIFQLLQGILNSLPSLLSKIPQIVSSIVSGFGNYASKMLDVGKNLVSGIWNGISGSLQWIKDKIKGWVGNVLDFIKKLFGIHSPSRVMRDQVGLNLGLGIGEGFEDSMPQTLKEVNRAMSELNTGIQASVNPIINPTANSNPLILNIDKFVNSKDTDIQQLAEELEFYRKNSALAKGDA